MKKINKTLLISLGGISMIAGMTATAVSCGDTPAAKVKVSDTDALAAVTVTFAGTAGALVGTAVIASDYTTKLTVELDKKTALSDGDQVVATIKATKGYAFTSGDATLEKTFTVSLTPQVPGGNPVVATTPLTVEVAQLAPYFTLGEDEYGAAKAVLASPATGAIENVTVTFKNTYDADKKHKEGDAIAVVLTAGDGYTVNGAATAELNYTVTGVTSAAGEFSDFVTEIGDPSTLVTQGLLAVMVKMGMNASADSGSSTNNRVFGNKYGDMDVLVTHMNTLSTGFTLADIWELFWDTNHAKYANFIKYKTNLALLHVMNDAFTTKLSEPVQQGVTEINAAIATIGNVSTTTTNVAAATTLPSTFTVGAANAGVIANLGFNLDLSTLAGIDSTTVEIVSVSDGGGTVVIKINLTAGTATGSATVVIDGFKADANAIEVGTLTYAQGLDWSNPTYTVDLTQDTSAKEDYGDIGAQIATGNHMYIRATMGNGDVIYLKVIADQTIASTRFNTEELAAGTEHWFGTKSSSGKRHLGLQSGKAYNNVADGPAYLGGTTEALIIVEAK